MKGGTTAAIRILDTATDGSRKEKAESVSRFPNLFSSKDGHPCYRHRLENDLSLFSSPYPLLSSCFFASCLPVFPLPSPPSFCRYLRLLRVSSSVQQLYVFLEYVWFPSFK